MTFLEWLKRLRARLQAERQAERADDESYVPEVDESLDPFNPFPEPVRIEITDVIDLHTIQPREVRPVVEEYLKEAHAKGFRSVRIIHGKGQGVQREIVRSILKETSFVRDWTDAPPMTGGWGATIAHLLPAEMSDAE